MDDLLNKPVSQPIPPEPDPDIREQLESLRHLAIWIMVFVLIVAGAFDLYLLRQVNYTSSELKAIRPLIEDFQKNRQPMMENFLRQLNQYGQTHPDFNPILLKYNLKQQPPQSSVTPAPSLASPAPSTPKK
jgi:hypothetical protein